MPTGTKAAPKVLETVGAPEDKLTIKQRLFVEHYVKLKNGTQAAKAAGYKGNDHTLSEVARENLEKPAIATLVEQSIQEVRKRLQFDHDKIIRRLNAIYLRSMDATPVKDMKGRETGEWKYDSHGALRSTELIGKHIGMWTEKKDDPNDKRVPGTDDDGVQTALDRIKGRRKA